MILSLFTLALAEDPAPQATEEPTGPATTTYAVDSNSWLAVLVKYDRSALGGGHDHVVTPNAVQGSITWNPQDPTVCDVKLSFPVDALQVDPPGSRARFSLEGETPANDKPKIKANLSGKHQLEASKFPTISYQSTKCDGTGEKVAVSGKLSIHGVNHPVTTTMTVSADGKTFTAKGGFTATHADFGMDPFTALLGALRNDEVLTFQMNVKATAK